MGRAGWALWLAYDLPGSYEETPSSLLEEMQRDRRWCQGNIQHLRLLLDRGSLRRASRALPERRALVRLGPALVRVPGALDGRRHLAGGARAGLLPGRAQRCSRSGRCGARLGARAARRDGGDPVPAEDPVDPARHLGAAKRRSSAGSRDCSRARVLETGMSTLFAPIRMVFHTRFVLTNLVRPHRHLALPGARRRARRAGARRSGTTASIRSSPSVWAGAVFWLNPSYFWWLTPVVCALILSVPLSVWSSRTGPGQRARKRGLFVTPEELLPPPELVEVARDVAAADASRATQPEWRGDGFVRAVVDPQLNAVHCALIGSGRSYAPALRKVHAALVDRAVSRRTRVARRRGATPPAARPRSAPLAAPRRLADRESRTGAALGPRNAWVPPLAVG